MFHVLILLSKVRYLLSCELKAILTKYYKVDYMIGYINDYDK